MSGAALSCCAAPCQVAAELGAARALLGAGVEAAPLDVEGEPGAGAAPDSGRRAATVAAAGAAAPEAAVASGAARGGRAAEPRLVSRAREPALPSGPEWRRREGRVGPSAKRSRQPPQPSLPLASDSEGLDAGRSGEAVEAAAVGRQGWVLSARAPPGPRLRAPRSAEPEELEADGEGDGAASGLQSGLPASGVGAAAGGRGAASGARAAGRRAAAVGTAGGRAAEDEADVFEGSAAVLRSQPRRLRPRGRGGLVLEPAVHAHGAADVAHDVAVDAAADVAKTRGSGAAGGAEPAMPAARPRASLFGGSPAERTPAAPAAAVTAPAERLDAVVAAGEALAGLKAADTQHAEADAGARAALPEPPSHARAAAPAPVHAAIAGAAGGGEGSLGRPAATPVAAVAAEAGLEALRQVPSGAEARRRAKRLRDRGRGDASEEEEAPDVAAAEQRGAATTSSSAPAPGVALAARSGVPAAAPQTGGLGSRGAAEPVVAAVPAAVAAKDGSRAAAMAGRPAAGSAPVAAPMPAPQAAAAEPLLQAVSAHDAQRQPCDVTAASVAAESAQPSGEKAAAQEISAPLTSRQQQPAAEARGSASEGCAIQSAETVRAGERVVSSQASGATGEATAGSKDGAAGSGSPAEAARAAAAARAARRRAVRMGGSAAAADEAVTGMS